jgi:hypothetical protein
VITPKPPEWLTLKVRGEGLMEVYWHVGSVPFLDVDGDYVGAWFPCVISTLATRSIDIPQKLVGRAECQAFPDWHFHRSK